MRIDTSEPSLIALFNKGQVGLIRTEFMRKDDVIASLNAENASLKSEIERLRKAGDDMAHELHSCEPEEQIMLIAAWNAAKEGRDAK